MAPNKERRKARNGLSQTRVTPIWQFQSRDSIILPNYSHSTVSTHCSSPKKNRNLKEKQKEKKFMGKKFYSPWISVSFQIPSFSFCLDYHKKKKKILKSFRFSEFFFCYINLMNIVSGVKINDIRFHNFFIALISFNFN